ncbi:CoA-binding protein [Chloroflexota bacterium]
MISTHPLNEILQPASIAVVGVSDKPTSQGQRFIRPLLELGFKGNIYPVNPKLSEILGIKVYPSLREIPGSIDYVISCVPASEVLNILEDCPQKGVKGIHLFTARFSETGRPEATDLEQKILKKVRENGIRLIGPNCMGFHDTRQGISWWDDCPKKPGSVGIAFQSSMAAQDLANLASLRGIRFSKIIGYGNALDLNESDFLDYLSQDPETELILMYVEGVKDGKRFFTALREAASSKPVIILKGGRGKAGARAAASHTASLTGSTEIWETLVTQAGAISAQDPDELMDIAVSFYYLPQITGKRVGIAGGSGGPSVLAADQCEEAGLDVIPLPTEIRNELKSQGNSIWDWIGNPADMSLTAFTAGSDFNPGDVLIMMDKNQYFDLLIAIMGAPRIRGQQVTPVDTHLERYKISEINQKPLLGVVIDKSLDINAYNDPTCQLTAEMRTKLIAANIPVYPTVGRAAKAVNKLITYYQRRK